MNRIFDVAWTSYRPIRQNGALFVVDREIMLVISEDTASVRDVHESIAVTSVLVEFPDLVNGLDVVRDSIICTPDLAVTHDGFLSGV